jgi:3-oxoacyl-[acyl-carrier-protein] synthase-3
MRPVSRTLGRQLPLSELDDDEVAANRPRLVEEGITGVGVSDLNAVELAASVVSSTAGRAVVGGLEPDIVVVCTDTLEGGDPTDWMTDFQRTSGTELTTTLMVSGHACANLVLGLETCRGMIASGLVESAALITADRVPSGSRFTGVSGSVYSDGAAACLVTTEPYRSFELLGTGMQGQQQVRAGAGSMAEARTTLMAMAGAATRALSGRRADGVRHALSLNLGKTSRSLFAMAASLPADRIRPPSPRSWGHCFSADVVLACEELLDDPECGPGDEVLALVSGRHVQSAMLLRRPAD